MESKTKHNLTEQQIAALVAKHFDYTGPIEISELSEGMMNAIYRLRFDGRDMVLKVGVNDTEPLLLSYEHGMTHTEVLSFREYGKAGLPVPEILAEDFSRECIDGDCFFMSLAKGQVLSGLLPDMSEEEKDQIRYEMGRALAIIHRTRGEKFGYAHPTPQYDSWGEAFTAQVELLLSDLAVRGLEVPADQVRSFVAEHRALLDQVTEPVLVNFDLWEANVFVVQNDGRWQISSVLDFERGFYGDPMADFAALTSLYRSPEDHPAVLAGYRSIDPTFVVTEDMRTRLRLYRMYLGLVVTGEVPRYNEQEGQMMGGLARFLLSAALEGKPFAIPGLG